MQVATRKIGNSDGILIPQPVLDQLEGDVIKIRAVKPSARAGWAEDSARLAAAGDDVLRWAEFGNQDDSVLVW